MIPAVVLGLLAATGVGAAARIGPDLKTPGVAPAKSSVITGSTLNVRLTTKNAGKARARKSTTRLYLSRDKKKSKDDRRLGTMKLRALKPGKKVRKTVLLRIPLGTPPGVGYRLLACADDAKEVRERNERNNCGASKRTLTVATAAPGTAAPGGGSGGSGGSGGGSVSPGATISGDVDGDGTPNSADCAPNDPSIHPGAADSPDVPAFKDTNCDGIDGDETHAIFVSPVGDDTFPGTRAQPKQHLAAATTAANVAGKDVYATFGNYSEKLTVLNGVSVYGGYGTAWERSLSYVTRVDGANGEAASATGATASTTVQHLTLNAPASTSSGGSSYGLRAVNSPGLLVERIVATGAAGVNGSQGGLGSSGANGGAGAPGGGGSCDGFNGGGGGVSGPRIGREGGEGGFGGAEDGSPPAAQGQAGAGSGGGAGGFGGANGDPGRTGGRGNNGDPGTFMGDGAGGNGGSAAGGGWLSAAGQAGANGTDGFGGGGGGGGGAQDCFLCDNGGGNGGGEGGDGGGGGRAGGGGGGGGGSFGILLVNSSGAVIKDSVISAANAGKGGNGGQGGQGGSGGFGGAGAAVCTSEVGAGGNGGTGGGGARGGHGGGGAGGASFAIYVHNSSVTQTGNTLSHGNAGAGGLSAGFGGSAGVAGDKNF